MEEASSAHQNTDKNFMAGPSVSSSVLPSSENTAYPQNAAEIPIRVYPIFLHIERRRVTLLSGLQVSLS